MTARQTVEAFLIRYPNCFPPIVMNITDGESTDGDPTPAAAALRGLKSTDGNVLLFNAHLSSSPVPAIEYPSGEPGLPDPFAKCLFRMSSELPPRLLASAQSEGFRAAAGARGFVFNADMTCIIRFLDIGTRVA